MMVFCKNGVYYKNLNFLEGLGKKTVLKNDAFIIGQPRIYIHKVDMLRIWKTYHYNFLACLNYIYYYYVLIFFDYAYLSIQVFERHFINNVLCGVRPFSGLLFTYFYTYWLMLPQNDIMLWMTLLLYHYIINKQNRLIFQLLSFGNQLTISCIIY